MNAKQKKTLAELFGRIEEIQSEMADLAQELSDDWDVKSEKWQEGEKGQEAETIKDAVQTCADYLESAKDDISEYVND